MRKFKLTMLECLILIPIVLGAVAFPIYATQESARSSVDSYVRRTATETGSTVFDDSEFYSEYNSIQAENEQVSKSLSVANSKFSEEYDRVSKSMSEAQISNSIERDQRSKSISVANSEFSEEYDQVSKSIAEQQKRITNYQNGFFAVFPFAVAASVIFSVLFGAAFLIIVIFIVLHFAKTRKKGQDSTGPVKSPFSTANPGAQPNTSVNDFQTPPSDTPPEMRALADQGKCMYCRQDLPENATYCPVCGKFQAAVLIKTFRNTCKTEQEFMDRINQWLSQYAVIHVIDADFIKTTGLGIHTNKYNLKEVHLQYIPSSPQEEYLFQVLQIHSLGMSGAHAEELVDTWKKNNPKATILSRSGGTHMQGSQMSIAMNGLGAVSQTQIYILYRIRKADVGMT